MKKIISIILLCLFAITTRAHANANANTNSTALLQSCAYVIGTIQQAQNRTLTEVEKLNVQKALISCARSEKKQMQIVRAKPLRLKDRFLVDGGE